MELARSHYNLGIVQMKTNRLAEARADYDRAVDLLTAVHRTNPVEPNIRQDLARALINRGILHRQGGRLKEAGQDYDWAITLLTQLHKDLPAKAIYKFELAIARQNRGNLLWDQGRHAQAVRAPIKALAAAGLLDVVAAHYNAQAVSAHRQALVLLRGLVADFSTRPAYKKKMANALNNLGVALASAKDPQGAEQSWDEARTLFAALAKDSPQTAEYHWLLAKTLGNLAGLRAEQAKWPEARPLNEQGIVQMQMALKTQPLHPDYLEELRNQYQDLAWTLVHLRKPTKAVQAAIDLASVFPKSAQDNYYAACLIARCVPLASKDDKTAPRYIDQAVKFLQKAVANASPDLRRIEDEKHVFQPLAAHPEFGDVMRALEAMIHPRNKRP